MSSRQDYLQNDRRHEQIEVPTLSPEARQTAQVPVYSYPNAASCPDCGAGMVRLGSCLSCPLCGFGACG
jgi:hypothetical protein